MKKILVVCMVALLAFNGTAFAGDAFVPVRYEDIGVREITDSELEQLQKNENFTDLKAFSLPEDEIPDKKDEIKTQLQYFFNMFERMTGMTVKATVAFLPPLLAEFDEIELEEIEEGPVPTPQQSFAVAITGAELIRKLGISSIANPRDNNYLGFDVYEYDEDFENDDDEEDYGEGEEENGEEDVYDYVVDIDGNSMYGKPVDSNSVYYLVLPLTPEVDYMKEPPMTSADLVEVHAALLNTTERGGSGGCDTGVTIFAAVALCGMAIRPRAKRR